MRAKVITVLFFFFFSVSSAQASNQKVLYTFTGGSDGGQPVAGVIFDPAGNLYGVTRSGGLYNYGTVFELTPSPGGTWTETVLYNFTGGADGSVPVGGLATDGIGDLFGTASQGGDPGTHCGTLFELPTLGTSGHFTVLYTFQPHYEYSDGCDPLAKLYFVPGDPGGLWGTTTNGGRNYGTTFIFDLDGNTYGSYPFSGANGQNIYGGINDWGYGATYWGGGSGEGEVYDMFPMGHIKGIHSFITTNMFGYNPMGELVTATVGGVPTMYGTTSAGGAGGDGTVYALSQTKTWAISLLHSFSGQDGSTPAAGLAMDSEGNLYGTTSSGGTNSGNAGTVFELTPGANKTWTLTMLHSFSGGADGGVVDSPVVLDNAWNLYGTTVYGGAYKQGVVYEVASVPATTTTLASSVNPSLKGQAVTFTAVVTSRAGAPPDGEIVSFIKGKAVLGTGSLRGGSASFTTSKLPVTTNKITALYGGDSNFVGSTSNLVLQVVELAGQ